jgi:hypothetical protein
MIIRRAIMKEPTFWKRVRSGELKSMMTSLE